VFFLHRSEIESAGAGMGSLARERLERHRLLIPLALPPTIRLADVRGFGRPARSEARSELRGVGVSPGRFVGTACVVRELEEGSAFPDDAVVNVTDATRRITTGQRLLIDGDAGIVSLLDEA